MKVVLASQNAKKIRELETLLAQNTSISIEVLSLSDIGFTGKIVEDGVSFAENACIKASVPARLGYIGIADDSGLEVDALNGAPGIYSARYAGENASDSINNQKLLRNLSGVPDEQRTASFVSSIACVFPANIAVRIPQEISYKSRDGLSAFIVSGKCCGTILHSERGTDGFGYDPLFYVPSLGKTFAELSPEEKNAISHRGIAMRAFCTEFFRLLQKNKELLC